MTKTGGTRIRRLLLAWALVCVPMSADLKPPPRMGGMRCVPPVKPLVPSVEKPAESEAEPSNRPPPRHSAQLLNHAADILESGDMTRPIPLVLAAAIGVVLLLSFF